MQSAEHLPLTCWKLQDSVRGFTPIDTQNFRDGFYINDFEEPIHINTSFGCHLHGQLMSPEPSNPPYDSPTLTWRSSSSQSLHGTPWRFRQGLQDGLGVETYGGILEVMVHHLWTPNLGVPHGSKKHPCSLTNRLDPGGNCTRHKTWLFSKAFPSKLAQTN